jgi:hypothetical protein
MQKEWRTATKPIFLWFGLVIPLAGKKSVKIRRKTCLQIDIVLNRYRRKSNLGHTAIELFLQRTPHDRNLPQAKLFNRSNSFFLFKGPGVL